VAISTLNKQIMTKSVNSAFSLGRIVRAFRYSIQGLKAAWRHEAAFRQELAACGVLLPVAVWLGPTVSDRLWLIASLVLVLLVELLNSAIEALVDWRDEPPHPFAGRAKDLGSAAVLLAVVLALLTWLAVLWPHYLAGGW